MLGRPFRMFCQIAANTTAKKTENALVPTNPKKPISHGALPFFDKNHDHEPHPHIDSDHELSLMELGHDEENRYYNNSHHLG